MEIIGGVILFGSYLLVWYYHMGLKKSLHPALLYLWGCIAGLIGGTLMF